ncbi:MAG TPA: hypothetical protein VIK95_14270 [Egibacteraceae bacterium]
MTSSDLRSWFARRVPRDWAEDLSIMCDRDEVLVLVQLGACGEDDDAAAARDAIERFRETTREKRMRIAAEAERRFRRKVSWGATCGDYRALFTNLTVPVMTRLRLPERHVLDTLIDAGVARSRSDALAWCVRLVARHEHDWLRELREAFAQVERVRAAGPQVD